jgi:hypothetical protein
MSQGFYSNANRDLVYEWSENWLALIELINNITGTTLPPFSPPLPAEIDEITYQSLHFWLMDHEARFLPLWKEFYDSRDWHPPKSRDSSDEDFPQKYPENPFLFFYEPENLCHLAQHLDLQSGINIWEPSECRARIIRPIFIRLGELLLEFLDWVDKGEQSRPRNESAC